MRSHCCRRPLRRACTICLDILHAICKVARPTATEGLRVSRSSRLAANSVARHRCLQEPWQPALWQPELWQPELWKPELWEPERWEPDLWEPELWQQ